MGVAFDDEFFEEVELAEMPADDREGLVRGLVDELESRVGTRLGAGLTDAQLKEFEVLMADGDQDGALAWLGENSPGYQEVVREELERVKVNLRQHSGEILAVCVG